VLRLGITTLLEWDQIIPQAAINLFP